MKSQAPRNRVRERSRHRAAVFVGRAMVIVGLAMPVSFPIWAGGQDARGGGAAKVRTSVAFWNVENLFDTLRSPFHDDAEFTPRGANRWDTRRYRAKIAAIARVVDALGADVVGLAEVENEAVVRDLVGALKTDYNYIHRTSGDSRGIDQALLYKGDKFFPDVDNEAVRLLPSGMGREFLSVRGELRGGRRAELVVCHMASKLNAAALRRRNMQALRAAVGRILAADPRAALIVMGDMNATPDERMVRDVFGPVDDPANVMHVPHAAGSRAREGSYSYRGRRYLYDWMMVSPAVATGAVLRVEGCGVFARDFMTESVRGSGGTKIVRPRRTFSGGDYRGGASDHLPVWMVVSHE